MWRLTFETGANTKATYSPPRGWLYLGSPDQLSLQPPDKSQANATITKVLLKGGMSFDDEGRKKLAKQAISSLPPGSEQMKLEAEGMNPLQIAGKDTYLVQLSYTYHGGRFSRYCLFLNLKDGQLRFQLTCRQSDYKELSQSFQKSLYSWQNI